MATFVLEKRDRSSAAEDEEKELCEDSTKNGERIIRYIESIKKEGKVDTLPEKEKKERSTVPVLPIKNFYKQIIIPLELLEFSEKEEEDEEEESKFLHDYIVEDDLSVDYRSAKKFNEYIRSLRKRYGIEE